LVEIRGEHTPAVIPLVCEGDFIAFQNCGYVLLVSDQKTNFRSVKSSKITYSQDDFNLKGVPNSFESTLQSIRDFF
jgi:hypothetical protein